MATNCRMKFHGIRAIHPMPSKLNISTGGNTACIELSDESSHVFINAGFGINLAMSIWASENKKNKDRYSCAILFSDFFWDSILGLPFFTPMHFKSSHIEIFSSASVEQAREALDDMSSNLMTPFNGIQSFPAKISFRTMNEPKVWGPWTFSALPLAHPLAPYPISAWRISHRSGIDIGIVMLSTNEENSMIALGNFLQGTQTLVCSASNGPKQDYWSKHRLGFDDALKLGTVIGAENLYFNQFHPLMDDVLLQSELRRLQAKMDSAAPETHRPKIHLATEIDDSIAIHAGWRAKAG